MADRRPDRDDTRDSGTRRNRGEHPTDVGRTMGGGSLGHAPAEDVAAEDRQRNNATDASADADGLRQSHGHTDRTRNGSATGSEEDAVMPADDATLKTTL